MFMSSSEQWVYIYRFTHKSNTYEMKFLNPCSEEGIHIATEVLHIYKYFPILWGPVYDSL